ncbi:MAG: hypothetical protein QNJ09_18475 [Paracoccaceae bacterium]|nr:hypothetical protein [Paracoccaceae bacterium]
MGWGAAMALAEEWSEWCSGPDEAYEILYAGRDKQARRQRNGPLNCPICGKGCKTTGGVVQHMDAKHKKPCHEPVKAKYLASHDLVPF